MKELHLYLCEDVHEQRCQEIAECIEKANNKNIVFENEQWRERPTIEHEIEKIVLHIASPGGDVAAGQMLVNTIINSKIPIESRVSSAHSMAFIINCACHHRKAYKNAILMHHDTAGFMGGKLENIKESAKVMEKERDMMDNFVMERTKLTKKELKAINDKKQDRFFFADEALAKGIIDEII